uniref:Adenylate kinase 7b n=3 Tax=Iconisemion striatum TaxID=60296 RepID=A0A1A7X442_9TELE
MFSHVTVEEPVSVATCNQQNNAQMETIKRTRRVFLNNLDSFSSRTIAKVLSEDPEAAAGDEEEPENATQMSRTETFQVVGTGSDQSRDDRPHVLQHPEQGHLLSWLMGCEAVIYDISQEAEQVEEATWAVTALHAQMDNFPGPKIFVLVSTVMTWASSSSPAENPALFSTYVVASGLQYGMGEQIFYSSFKNSWLGKEAELFGDGKNVVPTIHISDLARIVQRVIQLRPNLSYLLAVDSSNNTLEDIVKAISSALGSGKVQRKPAEDLFLLEDMSMSDIRSMEIDLQCEAIHIKNLSISWRCESGLVENIQLVLEEFLQNRGLLPLRMCVLGPPAAGKTSVSSWICERYRLHHITQKAAVAQPEEVLKSSDPAAEARELLIHLKNPEENSTDVSEEQMETLRAKLMSISCRNQGFVLDDFPYTYEQAEKLFDEEADESSSHSRRILPDFVLCLDASDSFLTDRVMDLPQHLVQQLGYEPQDFIRCLAAYRENNAVDKSVLNYYEERDIAALHLEVTNEGDQNHRLMMEKIQNMVGPPRVLRPSEVEERRREAEEKIRREDKEKAAELQKWEEETKSRAALWQKWMLSLGQMRQQEEQELEDLTDPVNSYLQEHVMPTLTQGLIHCCRRQPPDPVDFLAEFLFQNSPFNSP